MPIFDFILLLIDLVHFFALLFSALKTIGNDFVFGFIQAVDGEKVCE